MFLAAYMLNSDDKKKGLGAMLALRKVLASCINQALRISNRDLSTSSSRLNTDCKFILASIPSPPFLQKRVNKQIEVIGFWFLWYVIRRERFLGLSKVLDVGRHCHACPQ